MEVGLTRYKRQLQPQVIFPAHMTANVVTMENVEILHADAMKAI